MADLTLERPGPAGDDGATPASGDGPVSAASAGGPGTTSATPTAARPIDPRAVRVAVGPASRLDGEPAIVVAPLPEPLVPSRHTLAGRGPLGGTARDAGPDPLAPVGVAGHRPSAAAAPASDDPERATDPAAGPTVLIDDEPVAVRLVRRGPGRAELVVGQGSGVVRHRLVLGDNVDRGPDGLARREVVVDGWRIEVELEPERRAALRERARRGREAVVHGGPTEVRAIIPGRVVSVSVAAGDAVAAGQQILVVEAMKMQNELRAPRDGAIRKVAVAPGVTIEVGDLLLVIE